MHLFIFSMGLQPECENFCPSGIAPGKAAWITDVL
jgi:hypothetical protein